MYTNFEKFNPKTIGWAMRLKKAYEFSLILSFLLFVGVTAHAAVSFPYIDDVRLTNESANQYFNTAFFFEEECNDGIDNDGDGDIDCADIDCGPEVSNVSITPPSACDALDGSLTISVVGGVPPYRFSIDGGNFWQSNGGSYSNLGNGTYQIRVQNADETCIAEYDNVELYHADSPILDSVTVSDPTLCFLNNGTLEIFARGNNVEYSIDGGFTYTNQSSYNDLSDGVYRVRVRSGECVVSYPNVFISEPDCGSDITIPSNSPAERCEWKIGESIDLDLEGSLQNDIDHHFVLTNKQGLIVNVSNTQSFSSQNDAGEYIAFILGTESGTTILNLTEGEYIQTVEIQSLCYDWSAGYVLEICPSTETSCTDGIDNDGDGFIDCEDDDCSPVVESVSRQDITECDVDNGSISVIAAGGQTNSYVYSIDDGDTWQSSSSFNNLAGGVYQVLVANSDETCPRPSQDIVIQSPNPPTVLNVLFGNSTSCDAPNGNITILASGSMGILYSIDGGDTYNESGSFNDLSGGTYRIRIKNDDGSCEVAGNDVVLTDPVQPVINSVSTQNPSACGLTDGFITVNASGANLEYSITGGTTYQSSNQFSDLGEGTYNVAVRNADGSCRVLSDDNPVELTSGAVVEITNVDVQNASECDNQIGRIEITASGISSLQYSINGGQSFQANGIFDDIPAGDYDIVVSNADGTCPVTFPTVTVINDIAGQITAVIPNNPTDCDLTDGSIVITASEGSSPLEYRINDGAWQLSNTFSNLEAGTYTARIRNEGGTCEVIGETVTVQDPVAPTIDDVSFSNDTSCDFDNGAITIAASGAFGLEYSIDGGDSWQSSSFFADLGPGSYPVAVRFDDGSCTVNGQTVTIVEAPEPFDISLEKTDVSCAGENDGSITANISGGVGPFQFDWSSGDSDDTAENLSPNTYFVIVTDGQGCTSSAEMSIEEPTELMASATAVDDESCNNCLVISASGGTAPYEYSADGQDYQSSSTIQDVRGGEYTVHVRDANGCIATAQVTLVDNNPLACFVTVNSEVSCFGASDASVVISPDQGEAPYQYSSDNVNFSNSGVFDGLSAGTYTFYIRDNQGVNSSCEITLDNPTEITIENIDIQIESCFEYGDGLVTVTASGGTGSLEYSLDGNSFQANSSIAGVSAGQYNLVVRDAQGCETSELINVSAPPELTCSISNIQDISCFGNTDGSFIVTGQGGEAPYTYSMNGQTNETGVFENLSSGQYIVQVISANGCINTCSASINEPAQLACVISDKSDVTCEGEGDGSVTVAVDGGTMPITYELNGQSNTSGTFRNLSGGTYSIVATDANGCVSNCEVNINENSSISLSLGNDQDVSCFGAEDGSFSAFVAGGSGTYSYFLNGSEVNSPLVENLGPGTYAFLVSDDNGCTDEASVTLTQPDELSCSATVLTDVDCAGGSEGSVRVNALGGDGVRIFTVDGTSNTSGVFEDLSAGIYEAIVRDENGCESVCEFEITEPEALTCDISDVQNVSCSGESDGAFTVTTSGGEAPFTYSLGGAPFQASNSFSGVASGSYTVIVQDVNGCQSTCEVSISEPTALSCVIDEFVDVNCSSEANGKIVVSGSGGTEPYLYSINGSAFGISGTFEDLSAGSYDVRVQDSNGCISVCDLEVSQPSDLGCEVVESTPSSCAGNGSGSITVQATGGEAPYEYSIDGATFQAESVFTGLAEGEYTVSIRDAGNCVVDCEVVTVESESTMICEVTESTMATCSNPNAGSVTISISEGMEPFEYSIDGENYQNENVISGLAEGEYTIYTRDANGCSSMCTATISTATNELPMVVCEQSEVMLSCNPDEIPDGAALIAQGLISATDPDGSAVPEVIDESVSSEGCMFISTIRFRAMDDCDQSSSVESACAIEVKWYESNSLTAVCPDDLILECNDVNNPELIAEWLESVGAEDVCTGEISASNSYDENGFSQTCSENTGTQTVTFTVTDECGNSATCEAIIEIRDMTLPTLSERPADINVSDEADIPAAADVTATDECSTAEVEYTEERTNGNCGYTLERTWTATDECGNSISHTQRINVSESLMATASLVEDRECADDLGTATVTVESGVSPYTYIWSNGSEGETVENLEGGSHSVTVTDALACQVILGVEVNDFAPLSVAISVDQEIDCSSYEKGELSLDITGGNGAKTIEWENGSSDERRFALDPGIYAVTITDENGCVATAEVEISETGDCSATIMGTAWEDANENGLRDEDGVVAGVTISIYSVGGTFIRSVTSDAEGAYTFDNLPGGNYILEVEMPDGYRVTTDEGDSDNYFSPFTNKTGIIFIEDAATTSEILLGLIKEVETTSADLSLSMMSNLTEADAGSAVDYTITVVNHGPDVATGITVTNYVSSLLENISGITADGMLLGTEISWMINELGVGEEVELSFSAEVVASFTTEVLTNSAEITESDISDPNSSPDNMGAHPSENDEAAYIISPEGIADLELNLIDDSNEYNLGDEVTVNIELVNQGPDTAEMVTVAAYIPEGIDSISNISNNGVLQGDTILWTVYDVQLSDIRNFAFAGQMIRSVTSCNPYQVRAEVYRSSKRDLDSDPNNYLMRSEDDDDSIVPVFREESCMLFEGSVFLEGAYNRGEGKMNTTLYENGYLPGQAPQTFFGSATNPGQPYQVEPWNYCGTEGDKYDHNLEGVDPDGGYPENAVDYVLVSLREDQSAGSMICRTAALVLDDGGIFFDEDFRCCGLDASGEYYIVIEHRNHLPIMSSAKLPVEEGKISFDFTVSNSFVGLLGSGQKEIATGTWAMIAGNGEQRDFIEMGDLNVNDLSRWSMDEGQNSGYYFADYDLNGDVNVQDKGLVLRNFGVFSDVMSRK